MFIPNRAHAKHRSDEGFNLMPVLLVAILMYLYASKDMSQRLASVLEPVLRHGEHLLGSELPLDGPQAGTRSAQRAVT